MRKIKIFLIAGEASGDKLGASLIRSLRSQYKGEVVFQAVGGDKMAAEGVGSIFPMNQISLMGFVEILSHIFRVLKLIKQTVNAIAKFKPDVVVTIDSPGFGNRVAKQIDRTHTKIVHYVAPSVWAYKLKRAVYLQKYYDLVLALLPFEPPYFTKVGLACEFVGHPSVEDGWDETDPKLFRKKYNITFDALVFGVMCGSRVGEVNMMLPVFAETIELFNKQAKNYLKDKKVVWVFPTISSELAEQIKNTMSKSGVNFLIPINEPEKISMLKAMNFAIVKSGTISLEMAFAKVPMIVAYKLNKLTVWILRNIYKINIYASIVNILAKKEIIPELIQEDCTAEKLSTALVKLTKEEGKKQLGECKKILNQLTPEGKIKPSDKAAKLILDIIKS